MRLPLAYFKEKESDKGSYLIPTTELNVIEMQIKDMINSFGFAPIVDMNTALRYKDENVFETTPTSIIGGIINIDVMTGVVDVTIHDKTFEKIAEFLNDSPIPRAKIALQLLCDFEDDKSLVVKNPKFIRAVLLSSDRLEAEFLYASHVLSNGNSLINLNTENVYFINHPLVQHKISLMRDKNTGTNEFRTLTSEVAMLEGFVALSDLPTKMVEVETPIARMKTPVISGKKLVIVPILRAGLGMVDGILNLVPTAKVGHIGMYRDPETHEPHDYYCKLPDQIDQRTAVVLDPMLATGGSACDAITSIKKKGCRDIKFVCIFAAPEGVTRLVNAHPDVSIYIGHLDEGLNENAYIVGGCGDAGDRIFGTK